MRFPSSDGRLFSRSVLVAAALAAALGGAAAARRTVAQEAPRADVGALGRPVEGDVWTSGPRGGSYADATELSGRMEVARFLVQPAVSRGLRGLC
jgi:ABC-type sugar transport system substrate-binding protein